MVAAALVIGRQVQAGAMTWHDPIDQPFGPPFDFSTKFLVLFSFPRPGRLLLLLGSGGGSLRVPGSDRAVFESPLNAQTCSPTARLADPTQFRNFACRNQFFGINSLFVDLDTQVSSTSQPSSFWVLSFDFYGVSKGSGSPTFSGDSLL